MKNISKKMIILGIIIVIIIIVIILTILNSKKINNKEENNNQTSSNVEKKDSNEDQEKIAKLKTKKEAERIKTYLGTYFKYVEKKDYNSAYNLLYDEFKKNYFPTLEDYEKYIQEQDLPALLTIDYDNIVTQGELYIVTLRIGNVQARSDTQKVEKKFVVKENDYNDYYISFEK